MVIIPSQYLCDEVSCGVPQWTVNCGDDDDDDDKGTHIWRISVTYSTCRVRNLKCR